MMERWCESLAHRDEWSLWFAWRPVTLLTMEVAWLRFVRRRRHRGNNWHHFGRADRTWMYANPLIMEGSHDEEMGFWKALKAIDAMMPWPLPQQPSPRAHYWEHSNAEREKEAGMIKIEAGKFYRTRDGRKARLMRGSVPSPSWSYMGSIGAVRAYYNADGTCLDNPHLDLVAEWVEPETVQRKFNVGDKVRVKVGSYTGHRNGSQYNLPRGDGVICEYTRDSCIRVRYGGVISPPVNGSEFELIEPAQSGPVRTVTTTRKEIVPGVYGLLRVRDDGSISLSTSDDPEEIRALGRHLIEIADAKDGGK